MTSFWEGKRLDFDEREKKLNLKWRWTQKSLHMIAKEGINNDNNNKHATINQAKALRMSLSSPIRQDNFNERANYCPI